MAEDIAQFDGRTVKVSGADFEYEGRVAVAFRKSNGEVRYVIEDEKRRLFIHGPADLGLEQEGQDRPYSPVRKVRAYAKRHREFSIDTIPGLDRKEIYAAVGHLVRTGELIREGRGLYRLVESAGQPEDADQS